MVKQKRTYKKRKTKTVAEAKEILQLKAKVEKLTEERDVAKGKVEENYNVYEDLVEKYKELAAAYCLAQDFSGTLH